MKTLKKQVNEYAEISAFLVAFSTAMHGVRTLSDYKLDEHLTDTQKSTLKHLKSEISIFLSDVMETVDARVDKLNSLEAFQ